MVVLSTDAQNYMDRLLLSVYSLLKMKRVYSVISTGFKSFHYFIVVNFQIENNSAEAVFLHLLVFKN